ncbi:MAG: SCP2 sterol-binding domain-containing protein [Aquificaceae bacterium]|nr:SCP2 sterol-binding domain-containing protein [Aquificaceae bacterium]
MKGSSTLRASIEDYIRELKLLAHHIQETHGDALKYIQEPLLLVVELPGLQKVFFLISSEGITYAEKPEGAKDQITLTYKDLMRLVDKPSRVIRYLFEGRVRISGNHQRVLSTLQKLL